MKKLATAFRVLAILSIVGGVFAFMIIGGEMDAVLPALWYCVGGAIGALVFEAISRSLKALQELLDRKD